MQLLQGPSNTELGSRCDNVFFPCATPRDSKTFIVSRARPESVALYEAVNWLWTMWQEAGGDIDQKPSYAEMDEALRVAVEEPKAEKRDRHMANPPLRLSSSYFQAEPSSGSAGASAKNHIFICFKVYTHTHNYD